MPAQPPLRVLIVLERPFIDGVAKPMLEFAADVHRRRSGEPADAFSPEISFAIFSRGAGSSVPDNVLTQSARAFGVSVYMIDERHVFDLRVIAQLREAVQRSGADTIVTNGVKTHFLIRIAGLHRGNCRWAAFHHGYTSTNLKVLMYNELGRWAIRRAHRVLTVCSAFATQLESGGVRASRIRIQHLPVREFAPVPADVIEQLRGQLRISRGVRVLVTVGRLSKEKGHADLIRAMARLRERGNKSSLCLVVVGGGAEMRPLKHLSRKLGVADAIQFVGFQENVSHYLAIAELFVLPSHSEGSPNALLEAMATGIPVVATAVGGVPEIAENEHNALLVGSRDVDGLAAAISRLLADKALGERLAANGLTVLKSHAPEIYASSMISNLLGGV